MLIDIRIGTPHSADHVVGIMICALQVIVIIAVARLWTFAPVEAEHLRTSTRLLSTLDVAQDCTWCENNTGPAETSKPNTKPGMCKSSVTSCETGGMKHLRLRSHNYASMILDKARVRKRTVKPEAATGSRTPHCHLFFLFCPFQNKWAPS